MRTWAARRDTRHFNSKGHRGTCMRDIRHPFRVGLGEASAI